MKNNKQKRLVCYEITENTNLKEIAKSNIYCKLQSIYHLSFDSVEVGQCLECGNVAFKRSHDYCFSCGHYLYEERIKEHTEKKEVIEFAKPFNEQIKKKIKFVSSILMFTDLEIDDLKKMFEN